MLLFSVKVGLDIVFQIPETIGPEQFPFSREWQKTMILAVFCKSAKLDFFVEKNQFRALLVSQHHAKKQRKGYSRFQDV